jgi:hypothetical protein
MSKTNIDQHYLQSRYQSLTQTVCDPIRQSAFERYLYRRAEQAYLRRPKAGAAKGQQWAAARNGVAMLFAE